MSRPDRIILFSDVHLGASICNRQVFSQFVDWLVQDPPGRLVILGDLLDFWRRSNYEVLLENRDVLTKLFSIDCPVDYIVGNHDYAIIDIADRTGKTSNIWPGDIRFAKSRRILGNDSWYFVTHGYDLDVAVTMEGMCIATYEAFSAAMCRFDNTLGGAASLLWDGLITAPLHIPVLGAMQKRPSHRDEEFDAIYRTAISGAAHLITGARSRDSFIFGHTHWPFISKKHRVANTGSWCTEPGVPEHNMFIEISDNGIQLRTFPGGPAR